MSYWIYVEVDIGQDEPYLILDDCNCTSNLRFMFAEALGRSLIDYDDAPATEAAGPLRAAVNRMLADPDRFKALTPTNGWGTYDLAVGVLTRLANACQAAPAGRIRISR